MAVIPISATYISTSSFSVAGNKTDLFLAGRRVLAYCGNDGYIRATISSATYNDSITTVVLKTGNGEGSITSNINNVLVSIVGTGATQSQGEHTHSGNAGQGGLLSLYATASGLSALQTQVDGLDSTYATDAQLTAVSGALQNTIDALDPFPDQAGNSGKYLTTNGTIVSWSDVDESFATDAQLTAVSGALQTSIDGKADLGHTHTESDITDLQDYVTEAEFTTYSGTLQSQITQNTTDISNNTTLITVTSGTLQSEIDSLTLDHDQLNNLDYASAGHTGFASSNSLTSVSGSLQTQITQNTNDINNLDNIYATDVALANVSGTLQAEIDGLTLDHDQLNNLDYASAGHIGFASSDSLTSVSGALQSQITQNTSDISNLDNIYATDAELTSVSGALQAEIDGLTLDHDQLNNLDYASAGHTGFQPAGDYVTEVEFTTYSGTLQSQITQNTNNISANTSLIATTSGTLQSQITTNTNSISDLDTALSTTSGTLASEINNNTALISTTSGTLQSQITINSNAISDLDTVLSTTSGILAAEINNNTSLIATTSGSLQSQIDGKEDSFSKNTAFNKNFGSSAGTVCQGNDSRLSDARTPISHNNTYHSETYITSTSVTYENLAANGDVGTNAAQVAAGDHSHDGVYQPVITTVSGQHGIETISSGTNTVSVVFAAVMPDNEYVTIATVENIVDANPAQFGYTVTNKTTSGFSVLLSGYTDSNNYKLSWRVGDEQIIATISGGGTTNHSALDNLDYATAGHTGFAPTSHTHVEADITDLDKYTQAEVEAAISTTSGVLSAALTTHASSDDHDGRYYTETELNNGQLDNRYYTETEVDNHNWTESDITDLDKYTQAEVDSAISTTSGVLSAALTTHASSADHDGRYYTESEVDALTWTESDITDLDKYTQAEVDSLISTTSGTLQYQFDNLSDTFATDAELLSTSGVLAAALTTHASSADHDGRYYTESEVDALTWTESDITDLDKYTQAEVDTISGSLSSEIDSDISTHSASSDHDGRYYTETEVNTISGSLQTQINNKLGATAQAIDSDKVDGVHANQFVRIDTTSTINPDTNFNIGAGDGALNIFHNSSEHSIALTPYNNGGWDTSKQLIFDSDTDEWNVEGTPTAGGNRILTVADEGTGNGLDADTVDGSHASDFAAASHTHTESNITDLDKYTQAEVDTISGTLQTAINNKADSVHTHDDRYYTETETDTISGTLNTTISNHISDMANPHGVDETDILPTQSGNAGKYLTTNGTITSWATVSGGSMSDLINDTTPQLGGTLDANDFAIVARDHATASGSYEVVNTLYGTSATPPTVSGSGITEGSVYIQYGAAAGYITDVVEDTSPQLGGNLDANSYTITAADHTAASGIGEVVNVCYGTGDPPTASTTTIGTLYFKYTA